MSPETKNKRPYKVMFETCYVYSSVVEPDVKMSNWVHVEDSVIADQAVLVGDGRHRDMSYGCNIINSNVSKNASVTAAHVTRSTVTDAAVVEKDSDVTDSEISQSAVICAGSIIDKSFISGNALVYAQVTNAKLLGSFICPRVQGERQSKIENVTLNAGCIQGSADISGPKDVTVVRKGDCVYTKYRTDSRTRVGTHKYHYTEVNEESNEVKMFYDTPPSQVKVLFSARTKEVTVLANQKGSADKTTQPRGIQIGKPRNSGESIRENIR